MNTSVSRSRDTLSSCRVHEVSVALSANQDHWRNNAVVAEALEALDSVDQSLLDNDDELLLLIEQPEWVNTAVGNGLVLPIRGLCIHRQLAVSALSVVHDHQRWPLRCRESRDEVAAILNRLGYINAQAAGFSGKMAVPASKTFLRNHADSDPGNSPPVIEITLSDGQLIRHQLSSKMVTNIEATAVTDEQTVASVLAASESASRVEPHWDDAAGPRVFICMATYNPEIDAFREQIQSIIDQQHRNWHLLINDDCSNSESVIQIKSIASGDARISFCSNSRNQGFYRNFETALTRVPSTAQFVALADQDDRWYPQKLSKLLDRMQTDTSLAYCDMRILNVDGSVESNTYWRGRRNNYKDLDVLLVANTVTGAASLFRIELLETLLPFPARIGDAFHDHWIACAAMVNGKLGYVDEPLYDYRQHDASVVGHCDFQTPTVTARLRQGLGRLVHARFGKSVLQSLRHSRQSALAVHRFECRRIELIAANLLLRCPHMKPVHARALRLYDRGVRSGLGLLFKHVSIIRRGHSTNDAEIRLGVAYLVDAIEHKRQWLIGLRGRASRHSRRSQRETLAEHVR